MAATTVANRATVAATTGPALSRAGTGTTATPAWTPAAAVPGSADPTNAAGPGATPEEDPLAEMSGLDRVAALLVTLGPEASAAVLKHFPEREIERVTLQIFRMRHIPAKALDRILEEAYNELVAADYIASGGLEYAQELLTRTLGPSRAVEVIDRLFARTKAIPFEFLRDADPLQLVSLIQNEHPQTIALILAHLPPKQAAQVLMGLEEEVQTDVAMRVALMDRTAPEVVREVERLLKNKVASFATQAYQSAGGVKHLVDVLNQTDAKSQKAILTLLDEVDAELTEEIKTSMFTFEDVCSLSDADMAKVVREVDAKDLALALRGTSEELRQKFYKGMSTRAAAQLRDDIDIMGPQRVTIVEEAQQKIVASVRRLEQADEIVIARGSGEEFR